MDAITVVLWSRAKRKLIIGTIASVAVIMGLAVMPQKWLDRMDTIQNDEQGGSATGRLEIWGHAVCISNDRPLVGGGLRAFEHDRTYDRLSPEIAVRRNVHSVFFETLGTQGYIGLILFMLLGLAGFLTARKIKKLTKGNSDLKDEYIFANMIQISLVLDPFCLSQRAPLIAWQWSSQ